MMQGGVHSVMTQRPEVAAAPPRAKARIAPEIPLVSLVSLVLWPVCLGVGLLGLYLPYPIPQATEVPPPQTQIIAVETPIDPLPPPPLPVPPPDASTPQSPVASPAPPSPQPLSAPE